MNMVLLSLILQYSAIYGVDPLLAVSVAQVESGFNVNCVSATHDYGLYQLNAATFRRYTTKQLMDPELNIKLGIQYLAEVRDESAHQKGYEWVINYNLGTVKGNKVRYPKLFPYYKKVKEQMEILLKEGDKVTVKGLYGMIHDGEAIYLGTSQDTYTKGYYRIQSPEGNVIQVHPERVKKCLK